MFYLVNSDKNQLFLVGFFLIKLAYIYTYIYVCVCVCVYTHTHTRVYRVRFVLYAFKNGLWQQIHCVPLITTVDTYIRFSERHRNISMDKNWNCYDQMITVVQMDTRPNCTCRHCSVAHSLDYNNLFGNLWQGTANTKTKDPTAETYQMFNSVKSVGI